MTRTRMDVMRCTKSPTVLLCNGKLPIRCFQRSQDADLPTGKLHRSSIANSGIAPAQKTTLVQSTNGAVPGIWSALATTARSRHAAKVLWSSLFLHTPGAPNTTDSRSANNVVPLRNTCDVFLMGCLPSRGLHIVSIKLRQRLHNG